VSSEPKETGCDVTGAMVGEAVRDLVGGAVGEAVGDAISRSAGDAVGEPTMSESPPFPPGPLYAVMT
jgi:hypothetical protein